MEKVLEFAKTLINNKKGGNDVAVDATCGRGNDTLFLAGKFNEVYAFDIQEDAIISTKELLKDYNNTKIICGSNEFICTYVTKPLDCVMYNLGYLPKGDKNITTNKDSTIKSLQNVIGNLAVEGIITIICYPGHKEGLIESKAVEEYLTSLNQKEYDVIKYDFINQINNPPFLLAVRKIK